MPQTNRIINFTKMHGCKNDYIYIDCTKEELENPADLSVKLSDRHGGIGGDGIILICPSEAADFRMRIFNADGSEAEMCGNGIRCVGKYVYDFGLTDKTSLSIETGTHLTDSGRTGEIKVLKLSVTNNKVSSVTVDMGAPVLTPREIPVASDEESVINKPLSIGNEDYRITCISMGNPHAVTFVADTSTLPLPTLGPKFEYNPFFPNRTNTEFVQLVNRSEIIMRVWERGSGETLACGTGACAAAYAAMLNGFTDDEVTVHLSGGNLIIKYDKETGHIFMTGPAETVFSGSVAI